MPSRVLFDYRDDGFRSALKNLKAARKQALVVGVLKGATSDVDNGEIDGEHSIKPSTYAVYMEYGTKDIPPRPFLRPTVDQKRNEWRDVLGGLLVKTNYDFAKSFAAAGELFAADVRDTIKSVTSPELKTSTIRAKMRQGRPDPAKPLIDTGSMLAAVSWGIRPKSKK